MPCFGGQDRALRPASRTGESPARGRRRARRRRSGRREDRGARRSPRRLPRAAAAAPVARGRRQWHHGECAGTREQREQDRLDEDLAKQATARGAQRRLQCELLRAAQSAEDQQVANIAAGHEEDQRRHGANRHEHGRVTRPHRLLPREQLAEDDPVAGTGAVHGLYLVDGVEDLARVRFGTPAIDAGRAVRRRAGNRTLRSSSSSRPCPEQRAAPRRPRDRRRCRRSLAVPRRRSCASAVQTKKLPDDVDHAAEALLPQRVTDHHGVVVGRPARARQHAEPWREAEHVKVGWTERNRLETAGVGTAARADALFLERRDRLDLRGGTGGKALVSDVVRDHRRRPRAARVVFIEASHPRRIVDCVAGRSSGRS